VVALNGVRSLTQFHLLCDIPIPRKIRSNITYGNSRPAATLNHCRQGASWITDSMKNLGNNEGKIQRTSVSASGCNGGRRRFSCPALEIGQFYAEKDSRTHPFETSPGKRDFRIGIPGHGNRRANRLSELPCPNFRNAGFTQYQSSST